MVPYFHYLSIVGLSSTLCGKDLHLKGSNTYSGIRLLLCLIALLPCDPVEKFIFPCISRNRYFVFYDVVFALPITLPNLLLIF